MKKKYFALFLSVIILFFFTGIFPETGLEYVDPLAGDTASINWTTKVLRVKGNGFGPENVKDLGRRKRLAKRTAQLDAYRNLLESIKGVFVTSSSSVQDLMLESDSIRAKTEGMVKGMRVVDVTYSNDGACEITAEVNIDNTGSFLLEALSDLNVKVKDNYPKFDWIAMRTELEQTKKELASTQGQLRTKKAQLAGTKNELSGMKSLYAELRNSFEEKQGALTAANKKLIRAEEKLKYENLRREDLKEVLDNTKSELDNTKVIVNYYREKLYDNKVELAVKGQELSITRAFLIKKQDELKALSTDLDKYRSGFMNASLDRAALKGYIYHLKEVQSATRNQMGTILPLLDTSHGPAGQATFVSVQQSSQYTGILIDARSMKPKPVLAPSLLTQNREKFYGIGAAEMSTSAGSIADYIVGNIDNVKKHDAVGDNPLTITPLKVINGSDFMLSNDDVKQLSGYMHLLKQQKVSILVGAR